MAGGPRQAQFATGSRTPNKTRPFGLRPTCHSPNPMDWTATIAFPDGGRCPRLSLRTKTRLDVKVPARRLELVESTPFGPLGRLHKICDADASSGHSVEEHQSSESHSIS